MDFRELGTGEVRRISLLGSRANKSLGLLLRPSSVRLFLPSSWSRYSRKISVACAAHVKPDPSLGDDLSFWV
jgi:hypothetical protein